MPHDSHTPAPPPHQHEHGHGHEHGHHGHAAVPADADSARRVRVVLGLTVIFMLVEAAGGFFAHSLALLSDAAHMLTDSASLGLALVAFHLARRPSDPQRSYGYDRAQILAAFVNALALLALSAWITVEALTRLATPAVVKAEVMLVIALMGLVVNVVGFRILHGGHKENLNLRGASLHVLGDLLGSVAAVVAAVGILLAGWMRLDPLLSLLVAGIQLYTAVGLIRASGHILMEGAPAGVTPEAVATVVTGAVPEVTEVHHVHAWSLTPEKVLVTLHAVVPPEADNDTVVAAVQAALARDMAIHHATVQVEHRGC